MGGSPAPRAWRVIAVAGLTACALAWPAAAGATVIGVTTTADVNATDGLCSLREAITATNGTTASGGVPGECPGGSNDTRDTVNLPAGIYELNGTAYGELHVANAGPLTVAGAGAGSTTITFDRSMGLGAARIFWIDSDGPTDIQDLTLSGGEAGGTAPGPGGFIGGGAAIYNFGTLTVARCTLSGNHASGGPGGGNSQTPDGTLGSSGGAIFNYAGNVTVVDSTFTNNEAGDGGPAYPGGVHGTNATSGGTGGGATGASGGRGGDGGAIANVLGTVVVMRSVFVGNHAGDGGGASTGTGGTGGVGVNVGAAGGAGGPGTGGAGGAGGGGGAIVSMTGGSTGGITILDSTFTGNSAGDGGSGGSGIGGTGGKGQDGGIGHGGTGGTGGAAVGGAGGPGGTGGALRLLVSDPSAGETLNFERSLFNDNGSGLGGAGGSATGGTGGGAGTGALSGNGGTGGAATGGAGAGAGHAGAFRYDASGNVMPSERATPTLADLTVTGNSAAGGGSGGPASGGQGGAGTVGGSQGAGGTAAGGAGGNGGEAGGLMVDFLQAAHLTISSNAPGTGGAAGSPGGSAGAAGSTGGIYEDRPSDGGTDFTPTSFGGLVNSIIASNSGANCSFPWAPLAISHHNVSFPGGCATATTTIGDPLLEPLADNGGATQTQRLGAGSSALDLVPATGADCSSTDQRTVARPQLAACDAGAYEVAPPSATTGSAAPVTSDAATLGGSVNPNLRSTTYHFDFGTTDAYGSSTPAQSAGAGGTPAPVSADISGLAPSTTYHYRLVATNADGSTSGADQTFTTAAAPATGGSGGDSGGTAGGTGDGQTPTGSDGPKSTTSPAFLSATIAPRKVRKSATVKFALSEAARVTLVIESVTIGRRVGAKCLRTTRANRRKPRCNRFVVVGRLSANGAAGANQKTFTTRLGRSVLKPGQYRLTLQATDAAGNKAEPKRLTFVVVRIPH